MPRRVGIVDVVPAIGSELVVAEGGHLGDEAAIFRADVEAGADFIGDAAAIEPTNRGLLLHVEVGGAGIADGQKDERARSGLDKRIEVLEGEAAHIGRRNFLRAGVDLVVIRVHVIVDLVLVSDSIIGFKRAIGSEHEAVADQGAISGV